KRLFIIMQIGYFRSIKKERYRDLFGEYLENDFSKEIKYLKKQKIIKETPSQYKWIFKEHKMGHEEFFDHIIRYWYSPVYVESIYKDYNF
ncbi:MAG: hypothetical protein ABIC36_02895, partial [bacterium]